MARPFQNQTFQKQEQGNPQRRGSFPTHKGKARDRADFRGK